MLADQASSAPSVPGTDDRSNDRRLLARLESVGILDEAFFVVTADHGISFRPDTPRRDITDDNAYEVGSGASIHQGAPSNPRCSRYHSRTDHRCAAHGCRPSRTPSCHGLTEGSRFLAIEVRHRLSWSKPGEAMRLSLEDVSKAFAMRLADLESIFGDEHGGFDLYSFGGYDSLHRDVDRPAGRTCLGIDGTRWTSPGVSTMSLPTADSFRFPSRSPCGRRQRGCCTWPSR